MTRTQRIFSQWRTLDSWTGFLAGWITAGGAFALLGGAAFIAAAKWLTPLVAMAIVGTVVYFLVESGIKLATGRREFPLFPAEHVDKWSVPKMVVVGFFGNFAALACFTMAAFALVVGMAASNPTTASMLLDALLQWAALAK